MAQNTTAKWMLLLLFASIFAQAQYHTGYTQGVTDLTSYATSGTNVWKFLGGGGQCIVGTAVIGFDGIFRCVGTDHYPYVFNVSTQTYTGSERETVTPLAEMGVLILGGSGYTQQDERGGLEQSTGLAGVSGLPTRNRRAGQKTEAVGSAEARKPETDLLGLWAEASRSL
jgi:hypothetical protein